MGNNHKHCKRNINALHFGSLGHLKLQVSPMRVFRVLAYYTRHNPTVAPSALDCAAHTGMYRGVVAKIFKALRGYEAALGTMDFEHCRFRGTGLRGNLEVY